MILKELKNGKEGDQLIAYSFNGLKMDAKLKNLLGDNVTFYKVWIDDDPTIEFEMRIKIKDIAMVKYTEMVDGDGIENEISMLRVVLEDLELKVPMKRNLKFLHRVVNRIIRSLICLILLVNTFLQGIFENHDEISEFKNEPFGSSGSMLE